MLTHKATEATVSTSSIYVTLIIPSSQWKWRITHPVAPCTLDITALLQPHRVIWYSRQKTLNFLSQLISSLFSNSTLYSRGAQIPGTRSRWQLNFVHFHLTSVGPQHGIGFVSLFWHLEIWNGSEITGKYVHPCFRVAIFQLKNVSIILMTEISARLRTSEMYTHTHTNTHTIFQQTWVFVNTEYVIQVNVSTSWCNNAVAHTIIIP